MGGAKSPLKRLGKQPIWAGPCDRSPQGGVTQSMVSSWLSCRERFRLRVVEGLREHEGFSHYLEYGHMWHTCQEIHGLGGDWLTGLKSYCMELVKQYPESGPEIDKWYNICLRQFEVYLTCWKPEKSTPLLREATFHVPYVLPSGRVVYLRGKWDGVDLLGKRVFLNEDKTKGEVDIQRIAIELPWNFQTMFYCAALTEWLKTEPEVEGAPVTATEVKGVLYNVVRRPLGKGKHSIVQRKGRKTKDGIKGAETPQEFYDRLKNLMVENPEDFFFKARVELTQGDLERFQRRIMNPILEALCDWWEYLNTCPNLDPFQANGFTPAPYAGLHYQFPFGVYRSLMEGRRGDYQEYLETGNDRNLERIDNLFPELEV